MVSLYQGSKRIKYGVSFKVYFKKGSDLFKIVLCLINYSYIGEQEPKKKSSSLEDIILPITFSLRSPIKNSKCRLIIMKY